MVRSLLMITLFACTGGGSVKIVDSKAIDAGDTDTDTDTDADTDTATSTDTSVVVDTSVITPTADTSVITPTADTAPPAPVCDHQGAPSGNDAAEWTGTMGGGSLYYQSFSQANPYDLLQIEFYTDYGASVGPQTVVFNGVNYATCGECLVFFAGCNNPGNCSATYLARSGTLDVTRWDNANSSDPRFAGTLTNAVLEEVTIDWDNFQSTWVPNGQTWCINSYSFDVPIQ